ncbi:guanylate kinase [Acetoanaerobium sticklandii]|uniref:Guanylate kinase n=1 Tax=Acetoanaerobium sticklandii (strain ATCC 12662 / DSM 519 / JCM 1433 / CCUG 9281 / NCIMB 10654 / HF) TaxID=499177 RepID=E3PSX6_ACESD|nr:guanylate kinase [Acetoanaerobium sticklandii]CBH21980.1 guanylate kinase [Acetoanaerobium sticklandii]
MKKKGLLVVVSGPSGAGKGTICKNFMELNKQMLLSISSTTRNPRENEIDGVNYNFITKQDFEDLIGTDSLLEYVHVFGNYYGTPKKWVLECIEKGKDVLLEIEIVGAMKVKEKYPDAILVFVLPPSLKELKNRIVTRGTETIEQIENRMARAMQEIKTIEKYDYFIFNDNLTRAVDDLEAIISAEKNKVNRYSQEIVKIYEEEL